MAARRRWWCGLYVVASLVGAHDVAAFSPPSLVGPACHRHGRTHRSRGALVRDAARQELLDEDLAGGVGVKQQPQPDIPLVRHALPSLPPARLLKFHFSVYLLSNNQNYKS